MTQAICISGRGGKGTGGAYREVRDEEAGDDALLLVPQTALAEAPRQAELEVLLVARPDPPEQVAPRSPALDVRRSVLDVARPVAWQGQLPAVVRSTGCGWRW